MNAYDISATGLTAERLRMDVIANNIANVDSTQTPGGGPYKKEQVVFEPRNPSFLDLLSSFRGNSSLASGLGGVKVAGIIQDPAPPRLVYDPTSPLANSKGFVAYPHINIVKEMVDLIDASRAYQANVTVMTETSAMGKAAQAIAQA
ncbi:MAG: flagellar basal body rod protein FlgC [Candidatus Eremiobacteraeota bacterium]|jgi:flagellar basal-body rod protein FlgC|nr:flagellar basal body rod protein FlgC [Candidatus Eremiobacteraeota bacterium]